MNDAVAKALAFLAAEQDPAGFWEDWNLPVGPSRMWTTAYVGWRLVSSGCADRAMLQRAADWLSASEVPGGGWGYAVSTGADADSTALGILFLRATGREVPPSAVRRLLAFAREGGGFATYSPEQSFGAWTTPHVEVTATAILALSGIPDTGTDTEDVVRRAREFLLRRRRRGGLWDSYWWTSPLYATEACTRLFGDPASAATAILLAASPFEMALKSMLMRRTDPGLTGTQLSDGSWPSVPILRLTRRDVFEPHSSDVDAGPCFADPRRVFTTATVLAAFRPSRSESG